MSTQDTFEIAFALIAEVEKSKENASGSRGRKDYSSLSSPRAVVADRVNIPDAYIRYFFLEEKAEKWQAFQVVILIFTYVPD